MATSEETWYKVPSSAQTHLSAHSPLNAGLEGKHQGKPWFINGLVEGKIYWKPWCFSHEHRGATPDFLQPSRGYKLK